MPLPLPRLDDRDYDDLVAELRGRIPVHTPEWTDFGPADPGITLLELMAFLAENVLYRFNQIPDATWAQLLRLLAVPLRPAVSAAGLVAFAVPGAERPDHAVTVPTPAVVRAGAVPFETLDDVTALPVALTAAVKMRTAEPTDADLLAEGQASLDAVQAPENAVPIYYEVRELGQDPATPASEPLDVGLAVDGTVWIALLAASIPAREALLGAASPLIAAVVSVGVWLEQDMPAMADVPPCPGWATNTGAPGQVSWSVSTPDLDADDKPIFRQLQLEHDLTGGLRHDGVVQLRLPADLTRVGVPVPPADGAGAGEFPPVLSGNPPVVCWFRARPVSGGAPIPAVRWLDVNAARVVQAVTAPAEFLGTGTGNPGQVFALAHQQVQADLADIAVDVEEQGNWTPWTRVESLAAGGRDSRHWSLDAESGQVLFGDTVRSRVPQPGERIRVRGYRYGGGPDGNVPPAGMTAVDSAEPLTVRNPLPLTGGALAETLGEGLDRIPGEFRRHDRAVTASDFAELALGTPGAEVARADCLPRFDPATKATEAAGVITVVIWPWSDADNPAAPRPDRALLQRVCAFLDERRLVTTELYVVPPEYRPVAVSAAVIVKPGYSADAVRRWVELVVRQYLAPLPPYGPGGHGWPLGRRVHGPELEAAVLQVEGIDYVAELLVAGRDAAGGWALGPVILSSWEVADLQAIVVVAGEVATPVGELPNGPALPDVPPGGTPVLVPIPVRDCGCC